MLQPAFADAPVSRVRGDAAVVCGNGATTGTGGGGRRERLRQRLAEEGDKHVKIWARVRVRGERRVEVARAYGYRDGSGVTQVIQRLEAEAIDDKTLAVRLEELSKMSSVDSVEKPDFAKMSVLICSHL